MDEGGQGKAIRGANSKEYVQQTHQLWPPRKAELWVERVFLLFRRRGGYTDPGSQGLTLRISPRIPITRVPLQGCTLLPAS